MSPSIISRPRVWRTNRFYRKLRLDPAKQEIRLLELDPGEPDDKLTGRLFVASLTDNPPEYDALSYAWGSPEGRYQIRIQDGTKLTIGRNLHSALRDLRSRDKPIVLWTDAISIDQGNNEEVGHQVERMRQIYSQARTVRAWIDEDVDTEAEVFKVLPLIDQHPPEIIRAQDMRFWSPACRLLRNIYWKRLWVQQELILAQKIAIHCRRTILDSDLVDWLLRLPDDLDIEANNMGNSKLEPLNRLVNANHHRPFYGGIARARHIVNRRSHFKRTSDSSLFHKDFTWASLMQLFLNTSGLQTSEPRDRVYGLLGIAYDFEVGDIAINYELPVTQVYAQIADMYIRKYSSLMFLCYIEKTPDVQGLPTWLPAPEKNALFWWNAMESTTQYKMTTAHGAHLHSEDRALSVRGVCVDKITWTASSGATAGGDPLALKRDLQDFAESLGKSRDDWTSALEDENFLLGLFPWVTDDELRGRNLPRLTRQEQRNAVKRLFEVAEAPETPPFNVEDLYYCSVDLSHLVPADELQALRSISFPLILESMFGTASGRLAHADLRAPVEEGDEIWALYGCPLPLILRPEEDGSGYMWIACPANIPGLMKGEGLEGFPDSADLGFKHDGKEIQQIDLW